MKKNHLGSSFSDAVKVWEKANPKLRVLVEERKEKTEMAMLLKNIRLKEDISQTELAKKAQIPQPVIARIESTRSKTMPRVDLLVKLLSAMGYHLVLKAEKISGRTKIALCD
jgi:ribosome-binding protein aMBF1 (putative translation factor)